MIPLTMKSQKASVGQMRIKPKLDELKKKYGDDKQRYSQEMQKLYQEEGVNPGASCLPMFLQFFLLFGILAVVYKPLTHVMGYSSDIITNTINMMADQFPAISEKFKAGDLREELYIMERFADDDPWFVPWSPNASGNGRLISMLLQYYADNE